MRNSELMIALKVAYNATFGQNDFDHFGGSLLQQESFGRILSELTLANRPNYSSCFKTQGSSWVTAIWPIEKIGGKKIIPCSSEHQKITVLLHWGMNYKFLDDLSTWGHEKCPYRVDDVDEEVIDFLRKEKESNYWCLYDAIVEYKATGKWRIAEE